MSALQQLGNSSGGGAVPRDDQPGDFPIRRKQLRNGLPFHAIAQQREGINDGGVHPPAENATALTQMVGLTDFPAPFLEPCHQILRGLRTVIQDR